MTDVGVRVGAEPDIGARTTALVTGVAGLVGNVFLALFFALARPFDVHTGYSWLGPANDAVTVAQFAAFVPVAVALRARLPVSRALDAMTSLAVAAMAAYVVLQVLLIADVLAFETQVGYVVVAIVVVMAWILQVSLSAHRTLALPRPVTRLGVLVGAAFFAGAVLVASGFAVPEPVRLVLFGVGGALGGLAWLALPVFPLLLATHVFKERR
jgi:hypothetical protein